MLPSILVTYHFFERDQSYVDNLLHFLAAGYSESIDYRIVISGTCSIALPKLPNVEYISVENRNNDYGGYAALYNSRTAVPQHDFFIFVNSSVRGPFRPAASDKHWTSLFTEPLSGDVGLFGSTINILDQNSVHARDYQEKYGGRGPFSHIQTMAFSMPRRSLLSLREMGFFDLTGTLTKYEVVRDYEIRLSQLILEEGWNIRCLLPEYNCVDYRATHSEINPTAMHGDPNFSHAYFGRTPHPFEIVFAKANRGMFTPEYFDRLALSDLTHRHIPDALAEHPPFRHYLDRLQAVRQSVQKAPAEMVYLDPNQILSFASQLIEQRPEFRPALQQILSNQMLRARG